MSRCDDDDDIPLRLEDALQRAYPHGGMTVSGLRREAARGRLVIWTINGEEVTSLKAIKKMRRLCRVTVKKKVVQRDRVYFLYCAGHIKIGYSGYHEARTGILVRGFPVPVDFLCAIRGTVEDERELHKLFDGARQKGEWFALTPALRSFVKKKLAARKAKQRLFDAEKRYRDWLVEQMRIPTPTERRWRSKADRLGEQPDVEEA